MTTKVILLGLLYVIQYGNAADCTSKDVKKINLECNVNSQQRKVVSYVDSCDLKDSSLVKTYSIPCICPPGQGLTDEPKPRCKPCEKGKYSAGGEDLSDWKTWPRNGTYPPSGSNIITFCETYRSYVKPCERWKASFFKDSLESGENSQTRCMSSIMILRKQFVGVENYIKFTYRVEGRQCYNNYVGCDGLSFFVDNAKMLKAEGNVFLWKEVRFNVSAGYHELKFVYRKNCYSFPTPGIADKAFIQSITLVGTSEPNTKCKPCAAGSYSNTVGATACTKCDYFQEQPLTGQTSCTPCAGDGYSMPGSMYCMPKLNCTEDDLIMAPEPLSTCSPDQTREVKPEYVTVKIGKTSHVLCQNNVQIPQVKKVPCQCQPGYELKPKIISSCQACPKGQMSKEGKKCEKCPSGHVALMGKHYFWWSKGSLPTGFTSDCVGDCPGDKKGWIPSGDHIRTTRVVGDIDSFLQSDKYMVTSNIAYIAFNCSILCNVSQPTSRIRGQHLADINYCNLVFEVWLNNSVVEQVNCTRPKGKYVYRHERYRDGHLVSHSYQLKKGSYQFRWVFHQADELKSVSAAFEAKVYNISIVGVQGGSAISCTPCLPGYYSVAGNTDCNICPKGTASTSGASECNPCKEGYFADTPGSGECLPCGATTKSLPSRDGCTTNGCKFVVEKRQIEYDFSRLSRVNGSMFTVLNYQVDIAHGPARYSKRMDQRRPSRPIRPSRLGIWPPYTARFYLNLCTVEHDNTSCTSRATPQGPRESLPVMGCRSSWWSRKDTSIGRVIGFEAKPDPASGVIVKLLHGDVCSRGKNGDQRFNSTIDLTCDVDAGVGNPGPENNHTNIFRPPCRYVFKWRSLYACPKCQKGDLEKVTHPCINGTVRVTYARRVPCWGPVDGMEAGESLQNCTDNTINFEHVKKIIEVHQTINKVLIGVGVVVIIALLVIAGYYFYKHRDFKYKYYGTLARNKPMSRLEEEEEDFGHVEGDMFHDTRTMINR